MPPEYLEDLEAAALLVRHLSEDAVIQITVDGDSLYFSRDQVLQLMGALQPGLPTYNPKYKLLSESS